MKFSRFIISELLTITLIALCVVLWVIFAVLVSVKWYVILSTAVFVLLVLAVWMTIKYIAVKKRTKKLDRIMSELKEGYLLGETLPEPYDAVRWEYFSVMKRISHSAIDQITRLSDAQEDYREFIEMWIHEIKTPLTSCELLIKNGGDPIKIRAELKKAENLAESVLYYVRLRTRQSDVKITCAPVEQTAESAVRDVAEMLIAAGISVEVQGKGEVTTDHKAIAFSVRQLLVNCAKYCKGCKVIIVASPQQLTVRDNGCGISPHELPCIFNRGFVGEAGRSRSGGTGMGLYLVKSICNNIGVDVAAQSKEGSYTLFTFAFRR